MKNRSVFLCMLFLATIIAASVAYNISKPRVMILQSYDPEYAWTRDVDTGLKRVIDKWTGYSVVWHYMDTKKHSDPGWLRRAGILARRAINKTRPDVLIAVDDLAQSLAAKYFINRPDMDIVFAGVNGSVEPYGYHRADNVTGIFERKQLQAVKEMITALELSKEDPNMSPRLTYILDPSASLQTGRPMIDDFNWSPIIYKGSFIAHSLEGWKELIMEKGEDTDYIIVANYRKLFNDKEIGKYAPPNEVMEWTDTNSKVPVLGINAFNVEDGAMISVGVSPFEQGEEAAKMAQEIISRGIRASAIPMRKSSQYVVAIREPSLHRRSMKLPTVYEAFGRATENFIER